MIGKTYVTHASITGGYGKKEKHLIEFHSCESIAIVERDRLVKSEVWDEVVMCEVKSGCNVAINLQECE